MIYFVMKCNTQEMLYVFISMKWNVKQVEMELIWKFEKKWKFSYKNPIYNYYFYYYKTLPYASVTPVCM